MPMISTRIRQESVRSLTSRPRRKPPTESQSPNSLGRLNVIRGPAPKSHRRFHMSDEISRREFVKQTVVGTAALAGASAGALEAAAAVPMSPNKQIVAALGPLFVPSKPGDPGYKDLESHGITDYVMQKLPVADALDAFNAAAKE